MHKDILQDLILFKSSFEGNYVTLKEYVSRMKEGQDKIYYATGDTVDKIALLPQAEAVIDHGFELLYLTADVDEFALQMLRKYDEKDFSNVCKDDLKLSTDEEAEALKKENEDNKSLFDVMREAIGGDLASVRFTDTLKNHPVCLSSEGALSIGMEKTLNKMPGNEENKVKAELVLEINRSHAIAEKLKALYESDQEKLKTYAKVLYANARLISGMTLENPSEISDLVCGLML